MKNLKTLGNGKAVNDVLLLQSFIAVYGVISGYYKFQDKVGNMRCLIAYDKLTQLPKSEQTIEPLTEIDGMQVVAFPNNITRDDNVTQIV